MAIKRIDLSGERAAWRDVRFGRDVRTAGVSSLQKMEDVINGTVEEVNQAAIDSQAASRDAQQAMTDVAETLQSANEAKTSAQGSATAAAGSAERAGKSETNAAASAKSAAQSAAQAGAVAGFNGYADTVKALDTCGILGAQGAELNVQAIIDEMSRRVTEAVLQKTDLTNQIVNDASKAASAAALYSVNLELAKQNSNITGVKTDLAVKAIHHKFTTQSDWTVNIVDTCRSGNIVTLKIDATAKTTISDWLEIATGLPIPATNYFYQGFDRETTGSYKIVIRESGTLSLSNRAGKAGTYVDTLITYMAK